MASSGLNQTQEDWIRGKYFIWSISMVLNLFSFKNLPWMWPDFGHRYNVQKLNWAHRKDTCFYKLTLKIPQIPSKKFLVQIKIRSNCAKRYYDLSKNQPESLENWINLAANAWKNTLCTRINTPAVSDFHSGRSQESKIPHLRNFIPNPFEMNTFPYLDTISVSSLKIPK